MIGSGCGILIQQRCGRFFQQAVRPAAISSGAVACDRRRCDACAGFIFRGGRICMAFCPRRISHRKAAQPSPDSIFGCCFRAGSHHPGIRLREDPLPSHSRVKVSQAQPRPFQPFFWYLKSGDAARPFCFMASISSGLSGVNLGASFMASLKQVSLAGIRAVVTG